MAKQTLAEKTIKEMNEQGYLFRGKTSGTLSFRPGTNLSAYLDLLGLKEEDVVVKNGAKRQRKSDGRELLIFTKL